MLLQRRLRLRASPGRAEGATGRPPCSQIKAGVRPHIDAGGGPRQTASLLPPLRADQGQEADAGGCEAWSSEQAHRRGGGPQPHAGVRGRRPQDPLRRRLPARPGPQHVDAGQVRGGGAPGVPLQGLRVLLPRQGVPVWRLRGVRARPGGPVGPAPAGGRGPIQGGAAMGGAAGIGEAPRASLQPPADG